MLRDATIDSPKLDKDILMEKGDTIGQMNGIAMMSALVSIPFVALGCIVFAFNGELNILTFAIVLVVNFFIVFSACSFLIWRDLLRYRSAVAKVRDLRLREVDFRDKKFLATKSFEHPKLLLDTRNATANFLNTPPCKILERPVVILNPHKAHQKHAKGGVAPSVSFEFMLIIAIRARIDELLLQNTGCGCRVIHKSGETTYNTVRMPQHLTGRAINYFREIFGVRYPETQRTGTLTLSGKSSVVVHFEILGASPIGQARFTFSENGITDTECRESVDQYFKAVRSETPLLKRLWYDLERLWFDIRNWAWPEYLRLQERLDDLGWLIELAHKSKKSGLRLTSNKPLP